MVNGQSYFHINSNANYSQHPPMRPGDIYDIGKTINPFYSFYEIYQRTYPVTETSTGNIYQVPAIKFLKSVKNGEFNSTVLPSIAYETANHFLMLARELVWENVRISKFSDAPSRQRCIWLIDTMDDVTRWVNIMGFDPNIYKVVRVRATGNALKVDSNYLASDSEPLSVWFEKAYSYWNGENTQTALPEVLFEGRIEVEEIIETP